MVKADGAGEGVQIPRWARKLQTALSTAGGSADGGISVGGTKQIEDDIHAANSAGLNHSIRIIEGGNWVEVANSSNPPIKVFKKHLHPHEAVSDATQGSVDPHKASKFAVVMASGTIDADVDTVSRKLFARMGISICQLSASYTTFQVYELFRSNDRVSEYNEHCAEAVDLGVLIEGEGSGHTKVSWARTPRVGPFRSRDFVTAVTYVTLSDGTKAVINRPVEHASTPSTNCVRAEILTATNLMRRNPSDPTKTDIISLTHINPGGIVDTPAGAQIMNWLAASAPMKLLKGLESAAQR